jgi:hypothetical protein
MQRALLLDNTRRYGRELGKLKASIYLLIQHAMNTHVKQRACGAGSACQDTAAYR